jgi:hypothetical protein
MSEYQYYEFQAIDRPLSEADRRALRAVSSRARITATSFTNSYDFGDFGGDPAELMERWFDLHLYLANWGSRRLMIRLPTRLVDRHRLEDFLGEVECAQLGVAGENLILDIGRDELDGDWDDGTHWLAVLAPLRADLLAGDLRVLYLLWLTEVEAEVLDADEPEPMPGIGPMTPALEAFAEFFAIDPDLVQAAAERSSKTAISTDAGRQVIAAMADSEKTKLLARLFEGDPHVAAELKAEVRKRLKPKPGTQSGARTVGELLARAEAIGLAREKAKAAEAAAQQQRAAKQAEKVRRARIDAIARRGESVWREVESEIERRNAKGYDKAAELLGDLHALANERGTIADFEKRLRAIEERHSSKPRFVERLTAIR